MVSGGRDLMARRKRVRPAKLAGKLKRIRQDNFLTQTEMAHLLGLTGNQHYISQYETGKLEPSLLVLLKYARHAGVSTDILIDDDLDLPGRLRSSSKYSGSPDQ